MINCCTTTLALLLSVTSSPSLIIDMPLVTCIHGCPHTAKSNPLMHCRFIIWNKGGMYTNHLKKTVHPQCFSECFKKRWPSSGHSLGAICQWSLWFLWGKGRVELAHPAKSNSSQVPYHVAWRYPAQSKTLPFTLFYPSCFSISSQFFLWLCFSLSSQFSLWLHFILSSWLALPISTSLSIIACLRDPMLFITYWSARHSYAFPQLTSC